MKLAYIHYYKHRWPPSSHDINNLHCTFLFYFFQCRLLMWL